MVFFEEKEEIYLILSWMYVLIIFLSDAASMNVFDVYKIHFSCVHGLVFDCDCVCFYPSMMVDRFLPDYLLAVSFVVASAIVYEDEAV